MLSISHQEWAVHDDTMIQVAKSYLVVSSQNPDTTRTRNYCTGCLQIQRLDQSCQCVHLSFESMYGLNVIIPSPRDNHFTVWITACLRQSACLQAKRFDGTSKEDEEICKVTENFLQRTDNPVHEENSVLHAKGNPNLYAVKHSIPHAGGNLNDS